MDITSEQDLEVEEGAASPVIESVIDPVEQPVAAPNRDHGPWKFRPWKNIDHWVHEHTGASTFSLKTVR